MADQLATINQQGLNMDSLKTLFSGASNGEIYSSSDYLKWQGQMISVAAEDAGEDVAKAFQNIRKKDLQYLYASAHIIDNTPDVAHLTGYSMEGVLKLAYVLREHARNKKLDATLTSLLPDDFVQSTIKVTNKMSYKGK